MPESEDPALSNAGLQFFDRGRNRWELKMTIYSFPSGTATPEASPSKSRPQSRRKPRSITGRDEYIVAEALFRYIATEQAKPDHEQSWSNLQDCRCLFRPLRQEERRIFCRPISRRDDQPDRREGSAQSFRIDPYGARSKADVRHFRRGSLKVLPHDNQDHHVRRARYRTSRRACLDCWSVWRRQDIARA